MMKPARFGVAMRGHPHCSETIFSIDVIIHVAISKTVIFFYIHM